MFAFADGAPGAARRAAVGVTRHAHRPCRIRELGLTHAVVRRRLTAPGCHGKNAHHHPESYFRAPHAAGELRHVRARHPPKRKPPARRCGRPPLPSSQGLLDHLATLTRHELRFPGTPAAFPVLTEPTSRQREAFDLIAAPSPTPCGSSQNTPTRPARKRRPAAVAAAQRIWTPGTRAKRPDADPGDQRNGLAVIPDRLFTRTQASGLILLHGSLGVRRLLRPSPGVGGVKFECRCQPSRQRAQRPGLDLLSPAPFLVLGQNGECGEELSERRIRVSQVPLDRAQGPPMAQSQIHRDGHELNQAGQNHSTSRRGQRPARCRPVRGITLDCHRTSLLCQAAPPCCAVVAACGDAIGGPGRDQGLAL